MLLLCVCFFFQAEDGIRYLVRSRGLGDVYKRQELLVEQIINETDKNVELKILDIGVGSGNISLSLLKNLPKIKVVAIDISEKALQVAKQNAELNFLQDRIDLKLFDILNSDLNPVSYTHLTLQTSDPG